MKKSLLPNSEKQINSSRNNQFNNMDFSIKIAFTKNKTDNSHNVYSIKLKNACIGTEEPKTSPPLNDNDIDSISYHQNTTEINGFRSINSIVYPANCFWKNYLVKGINIRNRYLSLDNNAY